MIFLKRLISILSVLSLSVTLFGTAVSAKQAEGTATAELTVSPMDMETYLEVTGNEDENLTDENYDVYAVKLKLSGIGNVYSEVTGSGKKAKYTGRQIKNLDIMLDFGNDVSKIYNAEFWLDAETGIYSEDYFGDTDGYGIGEKAPTQLKINPTGSFPGTTEANYEGTIDNAIVICVAVKKGETATASSIIGVTCVPFTNSSIDGATEEYTYGYGNIKYTESITLGTDTKATLDKVEITGAETLKMGVKESVQLTATAKDTDGKEMTAESWTWTSNAEDVAEVSATGLVTAKSAGDAKITAETTIDGVTKSGEVTIHVDRADPYLDTITITGDATVEEGKTLNLTAEVKDQYGDAFDAEVTWSSNAEEVATVENGVVTAKKAGTAVIKAVAGGKEATKTITVTAKPYAALPKVEVGGGAVAGQEIKKDNNIIGFLWEAIFKMNNLKPSYNVTFTSGADTKTDILTEADKYVVEGEGELSVIVALDTAKEAVTLGITE